MPGDFAHPYDLIVVGRGAAAADYLLTLPRLSLGKLEYEAIAQNKGKELLPLSILVIGKEDPWAGGRGYVKGAYGQYVNQEKQVLQRRTGATAPNAQGPQDRKEFAEENQAIIASIANKVEDGTVVGVSRVKKIDLKDRDRFKVDVRELGEPVYGYKVVFASGAGVEGEKGHADYHMVPAEVQKAWTSGVSKDAVIDLDRFMKLTEANPQALAGKRIAVLGPTAGTDAVMNALTVKVPPDNLYWLMRNEPSTKGFANVYPGGDKESRQKMEGAMQKAASKIHAYKDKTLSITKGGVRDVKVGYDSAEKSGLKVGLTSFEVDYFVYSIGQTPANTMSAPPLDPKAKVVPILADELRNELEPVYDVNKRLGSEPWEQVTALQLKGSDSAQGIQIIGAAAFQMAGKVEHNYLQQEYDKLLDALKWTSSEFELTARLYYPELVDKSLNLTNLHDWGLTDQECDEKEYRFLAAFTAVVEKDLQGFVQAGALEVGEQKQYMYKYARMAANLCDLFRQRCRASDYLYGRGSWGKNRSVQAMLNPSQTLPASLSDCRLLAAVAANINALNASSPEHLQKDVNFLEDKTELRCYIAHKYPHIGDPEATKFINKVSEKRKKLGNLGFPPNEVATFEQELQSMEKTASALSNI